MTRSHLLSMVTKARTCPCAQHMHQHELSWMAPQTPCTGAEGDLLHSVSQGATDLTCSCLWWRTSASQLASRPSGSEGDSPLHSIERVCKVLSWGDEQPAQGQVS